MAGTSGPGDTGDSACIGLGGDAVVRDAPSMGDAPNMAPKLDEGAPTMAPKPAWDAPELEDGSDAPAHSVASRHWRLP